MSICIPVNEDRALASPVSAHFGSTPFFMLVDPATGACRAIPNRNQHHAHGQCSPLASLEGETLERVIVGGIGRGALDRLQAVGVPVYFTECATVAEVMAALRAGTLRRVSSEQTCCHHHDEAH